MLRNRGRTVYAIAQEMGVSEGTVKNRIKEALDRREFPHTDEYRNRQNDHLDDMVRRHEQTMPGWMRSSLAQSQREIRSLKLPVSDDGG
jgi:predicted transcriptional regulator